MSVPQNRRGIQRKCRIRARKVIRLQKSLDPSPASSSRVPRSPGMGQGGVDVEGPAMGMLGRASTGTRISKARKDKEAAAKFAQDDSNPGNLRLGVVDAQETQESAMPDGGDDESVSSQITTVASERCDVAPERSSHDSESVNETPAGVSPETTNAEHASLQSSNTPAAAVKQDEETVENDDNESLHEDVEGSSFEAPASDGPPSSSGRGPKRRLPSREPVRYWTEEEHRLFLAGVQKFGGRNYKALAEHIKTRTPTQVRTHLQKYLVKLQKVKRLKAEAETIKHQLGIGMNPEILTAVGIGSMPVTADPVLSAAAGLKDLSSPPFERQGVGSMLTTEKAAQSAGAKGDGTEVDEVSLVEVFEEMANESRTNDGNQGMNKNCHFCGHEPKRFGTIACCVPTCGQRFCEHCLMKHMSHVEKPGTMDEAHWTCPICRRVCCCVHESCTRSHRHCKRYRRARWRQQAGENEEGQASDSPSQVKTALKPKANAAAKKPKVDNADVCLLLDFCHSGA